jgi:hypothetical protein
MSVALTEDDIAQLELHAEIEGKRYLDEHTDRWGVDFQPHACPYRVGSFLYEAWWRGAKGLAG